MWVVPWVVLLVMLGACRPREDISGIDVGFRVEEESLDFGRVPELLSKTLNLTVVSTSRASVVVTVFTDGPFAVPARIEVPGGASEQLPVTFTARNTVSGGLLTLRANEKEVTVRLLGEGVRPLTCLPSGPCAESRYEFESHRCVESVKADDSPCTPTSLCQENGRCLAGDCIGEERQCDDRNVCTSDGCSEAVGCVNSPRACPSSGNPCKVPVCDAEDGCGEANAVDGSPCGSIDCVFSNLCVLGVCRVLPTADGTLCAPPTPCQREGRCQNDVCVRPDAGVLQPDVVLPLPAPPPSPRMLAHNGALFLQGCPGDGGCQLVSFTQSGLERFVAPLDEGNPTHLVHVSERGLLVRTPPGLTAYSASTGEKLWDMPLDGPALDDGVALLASGELVVSVGGETDAGARPHALWFVSPDGGLRQKIALPGDGPAQVAGDVQGRAWALGPEGTLVRVSDDGGVESFGPFSAAASLSANAQRLWVGGRHFLPLDGDAGVAIADDAGFHPIPESPGLLGGSRAYAFFEACEIPDTSCAPSERATWLRAFSVSDGQVQWEIRVLPANETRFLLEAAVMSSEAIYAVTHSAPDGGPSAQLQAFFEGERVFACPFPQGQVPVAALFEKNGLQAVVAVDGGFALETFDLGNVSAAESHWPQRRGVSGTRRAR